MYLSIWTDLEWDQSKCLIFSPMYGLFIDKSLRKGKSDECYTYNNHKLSKESNFKICKIEVRIIRFGDLRNQKLKTN